MEAGKWLPGLALALPVTAFLTSLNLAVDLARPLLDWISPQKAMKQNLNVLIAMLLDLGFLFLYGLAFVKLGKSGLGLTPVLGTNGRTGPGAGRRGLCSADEVRPAALSVHRGLISGNSGRIKR